MFSNVARRKLDQLLHAGFECTGFALEKQSAVKFCWINSAGVVLWPRTEDQAHSDRMREIALQNRIHDLEEGLQLILDADDTCNLGWRLLHAIKLLEKTT
jgi:hypothetical protein